jgi:GAF domain-containing protein
VSPDRSPQEIARLFDEIAAELAVAPDASAALSILAEVAARRVDGAEYAGITVGRSGGSFRTVAATAELVQQCDQIQYDLGSGPCVDAVVADSCYNAADLRVDPRWPEFGRRCVEVTGIVSMLSVRMFVESDHGLIAGLNLYSFTPTAFDDESEAIAHLVAAHGAVTVTRATAQEQARNLTRALQHSREIGVAMGILMISHKLTREQAFDLLRVVSQRTHRKLADVAADVAETGELPGGVGGAYGR